MKHHAFICCIGLAVLLGIGLNGCRTSRSAEKTETVRTATTIIEQSLDSSRTETKQTDRGEDRKSEAERTYIRTTEYDSTGIVRRVSEEWRDRRSADVVVRDNERQTVSVTGSETIKTTQDSSYTVVKEKSHTQADSRPVQGFEWLWVIVGLVLTVAVILFLNRKLK